MLDIQGIITSNIYSNLWKSSSIFIWFITYWLFRFGLCGLSIDLFSINEWFCFNDCSTCINIRYCNGYQQSQSTNNSNDIIVITFLKRKHPPPQFHLNLSLFRVFFSLCSCISAFSFFLFRQSDIWSHLQYFDVNTIFLFSLLVLFFSFVKYFFWITSTCNINETIWSRKKKFFD